MKVMISYFNNIRHFDKHLIPISTAKWDPKWYRKDGFCYVDKRGVINGIKCSRLVFNYDDWKKLESKEIECQRNCPQYKDRREEFCPFMKLYYEQLKTIWFRSIEVWLETSQYKAAELHDDIKHLNDYIPVLIVHEKPDRFCAERWVLKKWFKENGYELEEVPYANTKN